MAVDELEPFRKAAELGCRDFSVGENGRIYMEAMENRDSTYSLPYSSPMKAQTFRINRYASAVCAEWWHGQARQCREGELRLEAGCGGFSYDHWLKTEGLDRVDELCGVYGKYKDLRAEAERMIESARDFGRKYGAQ